MHPTPHRTYKMVLRRFYKLGFMHGDCNKYNFNICPDGRVVLIDFGQAKPCTGPALMDAEIASLEAQLTEMTGRGGGFMLFDGDGDEESGEYMSDVLCVKLITTYVQ